MHSKTSQKLNEVDINTNIEVPSHKEGQRLDNYLLPLLKLPRSLLYKSLRRGYIRLNSGKTKPCYRIKSTDIISVRKHLINTNDDNNPQAKVSKSIDVSWLNNFVIDETDDFIVMNKPSGLAVHGGSGQSLGLIESLRLLRKEQPYQLELVHRLDKDTSGLVLVSKKRSALRQLSEAFAKRTIKKSYYALLNGIVNKKTPCMNPLKTIRCKDGMRRAIVDQLEGKVAHSIFIPHLRIGDRTLCKVELKTGRMHQIRAHALSLNMPILGDKLYSNDLRDKKPLHLHAFKLEFMLNEKKYIFIAPLPQNWCVTDVLNNKDGPWNLKTTS